MDKLEFDFDNPQYEYVTTNVRLKEVSEILKEEKMVSVDTEGTSLDYYYNKLLLLQIGTPTIAYIFDTQKIKDFTPLKEVIENPKILKILQNGKFDYGIIKVALNMDIVNIYDTMLAEQIVINGYKKSASLGAMAKKYLEKNRKI